jgi:hypothetical protein
VPETLSPKNWRRSMMSLLVPSAQRRLSWD